MITDIAIESITEYADGVIVYVDGNQTAYRVGEERFQEICAEWNGMVSTAHRMPAFGVSLHAETVNALKVGVWAEFTFPQTFSTDGMHYQKLLVSVNPEWRAFNIIRYSAERGYDGRCFHLDLGGKSMQSFYNCIVK